MSNTVNVSTTTNQVVITPQSTKTVSINSGGDTSITVNQGSANTINISNNVVNTSLTPTTVDITTPPSNGITVTDLRKTITVNQGITSTVQVASIGPQGPKGDTGATGPQGPAGEVQDTGSLLTTASNVGAGNRVYFTKGDGSQFILTIDNVANATSASYASMSLQQVTEIGSITSIPITASIISASNNITASNLYSPTDLNVIAKGDIILDVIGKKEIIAATDFNISSSLIVDGIIDITHSSAASNQVGTTTHIVFNSWSGGVGSADLYLPRAITSENKQIRFLSDSTLAANKIVVLRPNAADTGVTIDGASSYNLDRDYEGVMVMCHNGQWWVIQRKSK